MIPNKMYSISPESLRKDLIIYTDDIDNGLGITEYKVVSTKIRENNIMEVKCINMNLNINQDIIINLRTPRQIYTGKLISEWRKM